MARRLRRLSVRRVALVDRGANQHAHITLYKRDTTMPDTKPDTKPDEALTKRLADAEAKAAEAQGQAEALAKRAEKAEAHAKANADRIAKLEEKAARESMVRKAASLSNIGTADDLGSVLYEIQTAVPAEVFTKLDTVLRSANEQLRQNRLFVALGADGGESGADAESKLDRLAKDYAKQHTVSFEKAYAAVLKSAEGRALYTEIEEG